MEKFQIFYQNYGLSPLEKSQFFDFFYLLIFQSKNAFFLSRILSNVFCWLILPIIKKMENFQIFDPNHGVTPLKKCQFLDFLTFCFYSIKKLFFLSRILSNTFSFLILPKIKDGKISKFFYQNHGLSPLEKSRFFDFFNFLILEDISEKAFFPSQNIFKHVFLFGFDKNKNMEKFPIFDRNHRLTSLEKSQFFNFFDFLILESKNTFFSFQNIIKHILLADFANNKKMENFQIFDQNHGVTPLEKCQFLDFLTFCFSQYKKAFFFVSRILSNTFSFLILPKIKRWKNFKFFIKTMD